MKINRRDIVAAALVLIATTLLLPGVSAQPAPQTPPPAPQTLNVTVQVTATRFGEPVAEVPGRSAWSPATKSAPAAPPTCAPRWRCSAASASRPAATPVRPAPCPACSGVREVDDLLLLIDGIPAGGAFIPQVEAISLNNVERIEVMRGAAPVYFGTTAFAGTINVIHYAAGQRRSRRPASASAAISPAASAVRRCCRPAACANRSAPR